MNRRSKFLVSAVVSILTISNLLFVTSCSSDKSKKDSEASDTILPSGKKVPTGTAATPTFEFSDATYLTTASASASAVQSRVDQVNEFYFKISRLIVDGAENDNFVFSPYSVQTAFALLYPATSADAKSGQEIAAALGFDTDQAAFHAAMHDYQLAVEKAFANPPAESKLVFSLVNQVWVDANFGLQDDYLDVIKKNYNSGVGILPIRKSAEVSRTTINDFIAYNTNDLIRDLIPVDTFSAETAVVLTNSVYMLADWASPFEESNTRTEEFVNLNGSKSSPETMHGSGGFGYVKEDNFAALSMDYVGQSVAMLIVLPDAGEDFKAFADDFSAADLKAAIAALESTQVAVSLPKFSLEWGSNSLKEPLESLGLVETFRPGANHFPKLLTEGGEVFKDETWIEDVFHKAKVIVDEKGTEAAAATGIVVNAESVSLPVEPDTKFQVNRPALFFIYEKTHNGILFAGQLKNL